MRLPLALLLFVFSVQLMARQNIADLILHNTNVYTVDRNNPSAEAIAVRGDRIIAVGSHSEVMKLKGESTRLIDLNKKLILPGFIDNHTHFVSGGFQLQSVDLRNARNEKEFADLIRERSESFPSRWIMGGTWDHENWPNANLPTKELIDRFTPTTPVFVSRYDGHMALANSLVLRLAGITKETKDPPGGMIVRDPKTGEPTGILKDEAMSFVYRVIPQPTEEETREATLLALAEARSFGLTSIQDMASLDEIRLYEKLKNEGKLTARFYCRIPIREWEYFRKNNIRVPAGDEWVSYGSLKAFADGSLGSSTALFFDPYDDDPSLKGLASDILLDGRLEQWGREADQAHLQLSIHAIGDSANSRVLDLFQTILEQNPEWDRRFRIEHAQHIDPKDFKRFADLNVFASVQPYHAIDDGRWAEKKIGHERCKTTYAFRTMINSGITVGFGSDWTVAPLNPLLGIYAAVTRRTIDDANPNGWFPEEKITVEEAVEAYTIKNAYASFEEHLKGSIEVGKLADFVVLSENIFEIDLVRIEHVHVLMTIVGGRVVYPPPAGYSKP